MLHISLIPILPTVHNTFLSYVDLGDVSLATVFRQTSICVLWPALSLSLTLPGRRDSNVADVLLHDPQGNLVSCIVLLFTVLL